MSSQEEDARDNLGIFPKWGEGLMFPKRGVGLMLSWAECVLPGGTTRPKGKLMLCFISLRVVVCNLVKIPR